MSLSIPILFYWQDKYKNFQSFQSLFKVFHNPIAIGSQSPRLGIVVDAHVDLFCTMKLLSESIRNFWEGFCSFYKSIYRQMKSWQRLSNCELCNDPDLIPGKLISFSQLRHQFKNREKMVRLVQYKKIQPLG